MQEEALVQIAFGVCRASMGRVHHYQLNPGIALNVSEKEDKSLLTVVDMESQRAAQTVVACMGGDFAFWGEEGGVKGFVGGGRYGLFVDPLDGTGPFTLGLMTSTVIVGVYDRHEKRLVGCVIGEPISGRIWAAGEGIWTQLESTLCKVWDGSLGKGIIFIDAAHGFSSRGRQVLTDEGNVALFALLSGKCKILMPGSNGIMQALVANGRERMAGSITTAVGFPGDVCGALLVKQAGGVVKAYQRLEDGQLAEADPMDPTQVDALICANNPETLSILADAFETAAGR